jgi:hypothetical protein
VGDQHHAPAALPPGKTRYRLYRRLGRLQGRSGRVRKISPLPGFFFPQCTEYLFKNTYFKCHRHTSNTITYTRHTTVYASALYKLQSIHVTVKQACLQNLRNQPKHRMNTPRYKHLLRHTLLYFFITIVNKIWSHEKFIVFLT